MSLTLISLLLQRSRRNRLWRWSVHSHLEFSTRLPDLPTKDEIHNRDLSSKHLRRWSRLHFHPPHPWWWPAWLWKQLRTLVSSAECWKDSPFCDEHACWAKSGVWRQRWRVQDVARRPRSLQEAGTTACPQITRSLRAFRHRLNCSPLFLVWLPANTSLMSCCCCLSL